MFSKKYFRNFHKPKYIVPFLLLVLCIVIVIYGSKINFDINSHAATKINKANKFKLVFPVKRIIIVPSIRPSENILPTVPCTAHCFFGNDCGNRVTINSGNGCSSSSICCGDILTPTPVNNLPRHCWCFGGNTCPADRPSYGVYDCSSGSICCGNAILPSP